MAKKMSFSQIVGSASAGNILEYYDFILFVYLAPHIGPLFFPPGDKLTSIIASLGIFAIGYFMRPLGAILFGYIGDAYGRKQALTISIILMAIPTVLIGCLPTYESIGIFSPILLTVCRLLQGLCVGGEMNGAGIFAVENVKGTRRIFAGSLISSSTVVGGLLGSMVAGLVLSPFMPPWAWRGAFFAGALIAIYGLYIRLKITENNPIVPNHERAPLFEAIRNHPRSILCTIGVGAFSGVMFNLSLSYVNIFLATVKHWPMTQSLGVVSFGMALYICIIPIIGKFADRIGAQKTMMSATLATIVGVYPGIYLLTWSTSLVGVLCGVSLLVILTAWFIAPLNYYMASLFPTRCRYSGVAFGYSFGIAVFGGTTPMILSFLIHWTNNPFVCVYYALFGSSLALIALKSARPLLLSNDLLASESTNTATHDSLNSYNEYKDKKHTIART
ncbi:MAG: MFS transporter [Alphaproteobacteria bacterium]|nr:MFS transporter [Alphaproteobacteria bacterium]